MIMDETMCMDGTFDVYVWMTLMHMWMDETYVYGMRVLNGWDYYVWLLCITLYMYNYVYMCDFPV
jgi:hypothetical protein